MGECFPFFFGGSMYDNNSGVALTTHALDRAKERGIDLPNLIGIVSRTRELLGKEAIQIRVGNLVVVARKDMETETPLVVTTWREDDSEDQGVLYGNG
jgi:hypothetical protein